MPLSAAGLRSAPPVAARLITAPRPVPLSGSMCRSEVFDEIGERHIQRVSDIEEPLIKQATAARLQGD